MVAQGDGSRAKDFSRGLNKPDDIIFSIIYSCHTIVGLLGVAPARGDTKAYGDQEIEVAFLG